MNNEIREVLSDIENNVSYHDGLATIPAYLLEQLHNIVFPESPEHDYTVQTFDAAPNWIDRHSITCAICGELADERETVKLNEGEAHRSCVNKQAEGKQ